MRELLVLAWRCGAVPCAPGELPPGYIARLWRPGPWRVCPDRPRRIPYYVWWLFQNAGLFDRPEYGAVTVVHGSRVVHRSLVFPRSFRHPFMGTDDVQIGDTFTVDSERGRGLAKRALEAALEGWHRPGRTFWYIVHETNAPSIRVAESVGFECIGRATRQAASRYVPIAAVRYEPIARTQSAIHGAGSFENVTETTGVAVTPEAASMMYTRYAVAAGMAAGRRVLEIACGGGNGLGLVGARARFLVGTDISPTLLGLASAHYRRRVPLGRLSAEALPFRSDAFDLVLFFEASYYVPDMNRAFDDVARVLAPGGTVLFVNANPERPDFISSYLSVHYHTAGEFRAALEARGFVVRVEGAFPVDPAARGSVARLAAAAVKVLRRLLEASGAAPRTLAGRARLKRLLFRNMQRLPPELPADYAAVAPRFETRPGRVPGFKVLYVTARKSG